MTSKKVIPIDSKSRAAGEREESALTAAQWWEAISQGERERIIADAYSPDVLDLVFILDSSHREFYALDNRVKGYILAYEGFRNQ